MFFMVVGVATSPPTLGRKQKLSSTERKRDDQSSPLPTKNFHPRVSANTRPSDIFLTEQLLNTYQLPNGCSPISVLSTTHFLRNNTVRPGVQAVSAGVCGLLPTAAHDTVLLMGHLSVIDYG